MLSLLRPIQYTGALLDACEVSSGALVAGADAWADRTCDGALESVTPVCGVATQPVRPRASTAGSTRNGTPGRFRLPAAVCPVPRSLMAVALRCSVIQLTSACQPGVKAAAEAGFQHGIRPRRARVESAGGRELQRERYEADTKLIPKCRNGADAAGAGGLTYSPPGAVHSRSLA